MMSKDEAAYYVSMVDIAMSGWGPSSNKDNVLIFLCDTFCDAQTVADNARARSDQKHVRISEDKPMFDPVTNHVQIKTREIYPSWYVPGAFKKHKGAITPENHPSCEDRVENNLKSRLEDLRRLWDTYREDPEAYDEEVESNLDEYALSFDYVPPETFQDQPEGFFRYQLSTGGPGDEFRIFTNPDFTVHRIEYWFLDWFDGASRTLDGDQYLTIKDIYDYLFLESTASHEFEKAMGRGDNAHQ